MAWAYGTVAVLIWPLGQTFRWSSRGSTSRACRYLEKPQLPQKNKKRCDNMRGVHLALVEHFAFVATIALAALILTALILVAQTGSINVCSSCSLRSSR